MTEPEEIFGKYGVRSDGRVVSRVLNIETKQELNLVDNEPELGQFLTEVSAKCIWEKDGPLLPDSLGFIGPHEHYVSTFDELVRVVKQLGVSLFVAEDKAEPVPIFRQSPGILQVRSGASTSEIRLFEAVVAEWCDPGSRRLGGTESVAAVESRIFVTKIICDEIQRRFVEYDQQVVRLTSRAFQRTFVYLDVSDFSSETTSRQHAIIQTLVHLGRSQIVRKVPVGWREVLNDLESTICIGDGFIYVFQNAFWALKYACALACWIERSSGVRMPEIHFRIGVHTGFVRAFWDQGREEDAVGRWNYIGDGINDGNRVVSAIGPAQDDIVFLSAATREAIMKQRRGVEEITLALGMMMNRGRRRDKHGKMRRLYEMAHFQWLGRYFQGRDD